MKLKKTEFLKRLEERGESRATFAKRCGVSHQSITAWVNGVRNPKPVNVKAMAEALYCRIEDIAVPSDGLETAAMHGDKFAGHVLGIGQQEPERLPDSEQKVIEYISNRLEEKIRNTNQSEAGRAIGLSASQINRMTHGKADLKLFPVCALMRLCPQIINRTVLVRGGEETFQDIIKHIKDLADRIPDIDSARTVERMLKGLVGE